MPFLRTKTHINKNGSKREYLFLVEGQRDDTGKVRQRTLGCVGRLDLLKQSGALQRLRVGLERFISGKAPLKEIQQSATFRWAKRFGSVYFLMKLWERWKYKDEIRPHMGKWTEAVFCMVVNRLLDPTSKLGIEEWKAQYDMPSWDGFRAHHFYRAMDQLMVKKDMIEMGIMNRVKTLFSGDVSMVMFDTTSVKHWGEGDHAAVLEHGYSKEKRGDLPQVMVGVLMSKEGIPFGHEVWKGNQSDVKSFAEVIDSAKEKYGLGQVIWVADRGMVSEKNLELLQEKKVQYILGVRMRKLDQQMRAKLLTEDSGFTKVGRTLQVKEVKLEDRRYIVCFNPHEARHERQKRVYFKKILERKVELDTAKSFLIKNGYKKYLNMKGEIEIDWGQFEKESVYDGKWVVLTNCVMNSRDVGKAYKDLWRIEQSFRILKSPLAIDPMFHWTDKRIRAHIFICFIALQLYILMKQHLRQKHQTQSIRSLLAELDKIHSINQVLGEDQSITHLTEISEQARRIFEHFNLQKPVNLQKIAV